jgi:two-component system sensor histidine kinase QseC
MKFQVISIQTRLTLLVLCTVALFGLIGGYKSYGNALRETDEIFDAQLAQFAQNLMVVTTHTDGDSDNEQTEQMPPQVHKYQQTLAFQVWNTNKTYPRLLLRSNNIANMGAAQIPGQGYSNGLWQNEHWRFYRQRDEERGLDVLVGQNDRVREVMAQKIAWHNIAPFLFGLPLLALFALLAIRFGLSPLRKLTESLLNLSPGQLHPVALEDTPKEIIPVIDALNSLLYRISNAMKNERRFTADASHELRTPLAALQSQVQAAQLSENELERKESLSKALQGAERMAHLIGQLLTLSRLDEISIPINLETFDLLELTEQCCADMGSNAIAKDIEISLSPEARPTLSGSTDMLRILLRNLLDNAIRYSPRYGHVEVALRLTDTGQAELEISDSGIGVADEQIILLGQRFNRMSPNTADGVGLGLSIVQRIAEIHHAKINYARATSLGGLSVKIIFQLQNDNSQNSSVQT